MRKIEDAQNEIIGLLKNIIEEIQIERLPTLMVRESDGDMMPCYI